MGFLAPIALAVGGAFAAKKFLGGSLMSEAPKVQEQAPPPSAATIEESSKEKAKADIAKRRRISLLSGGQTDLTKGTAAVTGEQVATKSLVGQ